MDFGSADLINSTAYSQAVDNTAKYDNTLNKDYAGATDEELVDACKEFETYFIEQMFKSMQKMVPESEYTSSSTKTMTEYYKEQLISEYASNAANQGDGLGIAQMLYEQMKRNYDL